MKSISSCLDITLSVNALESLGRGVPRHQAPDIRTYLDPLSRALYHSFGSARDVGYVT